MPRQPWSRMVAATQAHSGVLTRLMWFEDFAWEHPFEGIWACASLLHVAEADLPRVIDRLAAHLVPGARTHGPETLPGLGDHMKHSHETPLIM